MNADASTIRRSERIPCPVMSVDSSAQTERLLQQASGDHLEREGLLRASKIDSTRASTK
jgi:hypothetical protein